MHEMGIAIEIHSACRAAVSEHGPGHILRARVAVGELSAVEPDLLRFAWEAVTADGPDAESQLDVIWCPAHQQCPACEKDVERSEGSWLRLCGECGGPLMVDGGDELDVLEVVFESYDDGDATD